MTAKPRLLALSLFVFSCCLVGPEGLAQNNSNSTGVNRSLATENAAAARKLIDEYFAAYQRNDLAAAAKIYRSLEPLRVIYERWVMTPRRCYRSPPVAAPTQQRGPPTIRLASSSV